MSIVHLEDLQRRAAEFNAKREQGIVDALADVLAKFLAAWAPARLGPPHAIRRCPRCGGDVDHGFGLMGGGYGPYVFCIGTSLRGPGRECGFFHKRQSSE